jgi:perosamine synthetase
MIPIFEPYFNGNEKKYLKDCIDSTWISSQGEYILKFEKALADYHSMQQAIVTSNCTSALHLSLKALGIGSGDEVICPALTFIAPANMVVLSGAKLVLVDIHPETLTIDPELVEEKITSKTKAIIVVHQFGHAAHMDEIISLAERYELKVIEDNAESIGAKYKGKLLGKFGDVSTYSFFGNKIITTGEGGAVLTNNKKTAIKCRELRDHGIDHKKKYHHVDLGYNYRMTNMQAAIGLAQIENLDKILTLRMHQMDYYYSELSNINGITLRNYADWCDPVHWMMTIKLDEKYKRDEFISFMKGEEIDCRQMINPVNKADHFIDHFDEYFRVSEKLSMQSVHLPSSTVLTKRDINFIVKNIKIYIKT